MSTAIVGNAVDCAESVPKQYPKRKPPLAFYALSSPKVAEMVASATTAMDLPLSGRKKLGAPAFYKVVVK
ncbi:MAG: hypothetical protein WCA13_18860 [Terriglobales bacterium]